MFSVTPDELKTAQVHAYLLGAVAPRPIAFASTVDAEGNPNLSPFSFFNVFSAKPPILIFSPARRVRDNSEKHTLKNVQTVKEVVINVVNYEIVQQMSLSSTEYPEGVNEFTKSGLTPVASDLIKPFRVAESPVQFECLVNDVVSLGKEGGAGNLVICEVVKIHIQEKYLDENRQIDHRKIDLVARMGANWYCRASEGMFEIPKPLSTLGIGVDQIPENIRKSKILTGNDLGMLGNVDILPTQIEILEFVSNLKAEILSNTESKHRLAKEYLSRNDVQNAWKILLANT
ncbi:MAG: flavin reductase family protein [Flavobacteriaceae bacterium]|nr:flavin reductase family protein [Flavobacteriaceae bacterium]MDZ4147002.1 flavin reductase family protein [Flavobacteriaceae bacterium]